MLSARLEILEIVMQLDPYFSGEPRVSNFSYELELPSPNTSLM